MTRAINLWRQYTPESLWQQLAIVFVLCASISILHILSVKGIDPHLNGNNHFGDSGQYIRTALGFLKTGNYNWFSGSDYLLGYGNAQDYAPELAMLPGFALLITAMYSLFGIHNFLAVGIAQSVVVGLTAVGVAITARAFNPKWGFPAGLLVSVWPNLMFWSSVILSEPLFVFFVTWGSCALIWALKGRNLALLLLAAGLCFGGANLTRHVLILLSVFLLPTLVYALRESLQISWARAVLAAATPLVVAYLVYLPVVLHQYRHTGYLTLEHPTQMNFTYEKIYPCLTQKWGCGRGNNEAFYKMEDRFNERVQLLSDADRNNKVAMARLRHQVGLEMIREIPMLQLASASLGAAIKGMFHTVYYDELRRLGLPTVHFNKSAGTGFFEKFKNFISDVLSTPAMWGWIPFQAVLFLTRGIQIVGLVHGLTDRRSRPSVLVMMALMTSFMVVMFLGIGNFRYRAPIEPFLVIFLIMGASFIWKRFFAGENSVEAVNAPKRVLAD